MSEQTDTYALSWLNPKTREWWYIPTVPEARKWRGPYNTKSWLDDAIHNELGDATVTQTDVTPPDL